ncbi:hypothetical protein niasHS_016338 [Heterodera schachtii]|uniref:Uncharacterized protein n=1 Tax=Heterodera schachtii TaxID=97005 RepID=A0ABD2I664_HETSC
MVGQLIKENAHWLCAFARTKSSKKCKKFIRKASTGQLLELVEICLNLVASRFRLTTRQKKRLMPYVNTVRRMSRARSERGARRVLVQKGAGFGGLFAAL